MNNVGFIVEGLMEKDIIEKICGGQIIRMLHNGKAVSPSALAKQAATLIKLMKHARLVVVIFDREKRSESCSELEQAFVQELSRLGVEKQVIVGIPDIMMENWILACSSVRRKYGIDFDTEGCHGKGKLSELLAKKGEHYHERAVGVEMFLGIDRQSARRNSISFRAFSASLAPYCPWIGRRISRRKRALIDG